MLADWIYNLKVSSYVMNIPVTEPYHPSDQGYVYNDTMQDMTGQYGWEQCVTYVYSIKFHDDWLSIDNKVLLKYLDWFG